MYLLNWFPPIFKISFCNTGQWIVFINLVIRKLLLTRYIFFVKVNFSVSLFVRSLFLIFVFTFYLCFIYRSSGIGIVLYLCFRKHPCYRLCLLVTLSLLQIRYKVIKNNIRPWITTNVFSLNCDYCQWTCMVRNLVHVHT